MRLRLTAGQAVDRVLEQRGAVGKMEYVVLQEPRPTVAADVRLSNIY